jgi:hypothetical protein
MGIDECRKLAPVEDVRAAVRHKLHSFEGKTHTYECWS